MLGTNDAKQRFGMNAHTIAQSLQQLVMQVRLYGMNAVGDGRAAHRRAAAHRRKPAAHGPDRKFWRPGHETSHGFAKEFLKISRIQKADFLDAAQFCAPSQRDAVHLTAQGHLALAEGLAAKVRAMLAEQ